MKPFEAPTRNKFVHDQYERYLACWVWMAGALTATIVAWTIGMLLSFWFNQNDNQSINITGTVQVYGVSDADGSLLSESIKSAVTESLRIDLAEVDDRLGETWSAIQGIGLISAVIGVLITVLVLYFSFQNSASISRAEEKLNDAKNELTDTAKETAKGTAKEEVVAYLEGDAETSDYENAGINPPETKPPSEKYRESRVAVKVRGAVRALIKDELRLFLNENPDAINSSIKTFLEEDVNVGLDESGQARGLPRILYMHQLATHKFESSGIQINKYELVKYEAAVARRDANNFCDLVCVELRLIDELQSKDIKDKILKLSDLDAANLNKLWLGRYANTMDWANKPLHTKIDEIKGLLMKLKGVLGLT